MDEVGPFSERMHASSDPDLWLRISARWPVVFIPEELALYRVHDNNNWARLFRSGVVFKERLLMLDNASATLASSRFASEGNEKNIRALFGANVLATLRDLCRSRRYGAAINYFYFALKLRPSLLSDVRSALKTHRTTVKKK